MLLNICLPLAAYKKKNKPTKTDPITQWQSLPRHLNQKNLKNTIIVNAGANGKELCQIIERPKK
jgi:hypothetical protein